MKEMIDKLDFIKLKISALWETMSRGWKAKPQTRRKISAKDTSDKVLSCKIQGRAKIGLQLWVHET